jgi:hypothetical protein
MQMVALCGCGQDDERKGGDARPRQYAYEYGHKMFFGLGGDAERFEAKGWSAMEPNFTWTDGNVASLGIRLPRSNAPVILAAKLGAILSPPRIPSQPVDVYVRDEKIAHWEVIDDKIYTAVIPPKFTAAWETPVFIDFHIPNAISPAELGGSGDQRKLGLRVTEITVGEKTQLAPEALADLPYAYGEKIGFGYGGGSERYRGGGWGATEPAFTWTDGPSASLKFKLRQSAGDVTLLIKTAGMNKLPERPFQHVDVSVGAQKIAQWEVSNEDTFSAVIPKAALPEVENDVVLKFALPDAISPAVLGTGADTRQLGLRVSEATIVEASDARAGNAAKPIGH